MGGAPPARAEAAGVFQAGCFLSGSRHSSAAHASEAPAQASRARPRARRNTRPARSSQRALRAAAAPPANAALPPLVPRACARAAMVAAAAIAANKKRQAKAKAKRDALRKQLENDKREAEGFFNEISTDDGKTIPSDKLADLLQRAIGDDHTVNDDGKAMVLNHLGKKQGSEPPHENLQLPKDDVVEAIGKYRYFLTHADKIERLFAEFDKNHNNILEKAELKKAMQAIEDREHSGVMRGSCSAWRRACGSRTRTWTTSWSSATSRATAGSTAPRPCRRWRGGIRWPTSTSSSRRAAPAPSPSLPACFCSPSCVRRYYGRLRRAALRALAGAVGGRLLAALGGVALAPPASPPVVLLCLCASSRGRRAGRGSLGRPTKPRLTLCWPQIRWDALE